MDTPTTQKVVITDYETAVAEVPHQTERIPKPGTIQYIVWRALRLAMAQQVLVWIDTTDGLYTLYDDTTGQRQARIAPYCSPGGNPNFAFCIFKVVRHCTFFNKGDEGKEDAVLGTIVVSNDKKPDTIKIINARQIIYGTLNIRFDKDVIE